VAAAASDAAGNQPIGLANALELEVLWTDATCLKANIHFPVDWVLLRDATRTLMKAVKLIRQHGMIHRMDQPEAFLTRMNKLCMEMSTARRGANGKKQRKEVLRQTKRLLKTVEGHARRYRVLLDEQWEQTDWTRKTGRSGAGAHRRGAGTTAGGGASGARAHYRGTAGLQ
jgi:hypothetical protein